MLPQRFNEWRKRHPNIESLAIAFVIAMALRSSVVQAFWVPSGSMLPTIEIGDHIFVNKLAYEVRLPWIGTELFQTGELKRGEVIVFVSPVDGKTDLIKRVVAVAGDRVEVRAKKLYVNDVLVDDSSAQFVDPRVSPTGPRDNYGPVVVPEGKFFVMGDNRDKSYDSRFWGFADVARIKGRATFVYWSWSREAHRPRFERFGRFIR